MEEKKIKCESVEERKYIVFDWNVIQYIKNPRTENDCDRQLSELLPILKKKYYFPFCEVHLRDLKTSYVQGHFDMVNNDLEFLEILSQGVGIIKRNEEKCLANCSLRTYFDFILNEEIPDIKLTPKINSISKIDVDKLDLNSPLKPLLDKTDGILSPCFFYLWLEEKFKTFFTEKDDYKDLRNYIQKIKNDLCSIYTNEQYGKQLIECVTPFFNALEITDIVELDSVWKNTVNSWLKLNFPQTSPNLELTMLISYALLDFHPLFQEKIKNKNKLDNLVRDAKMVYYASSSEYFVTEDSSCYKKAKFIFSVYDIKTKVVKIEELTSRFS